MAEQPLVLFRLDATARIGSGHAIRCLSIGRVLERAGAVVEYVVSSAESQRFFKGDGFAVHVIEGNPFALGKDDGRKLVDLCKRREADALVVDTYGARDEFYDEVSIARAPNLLFATIDDMYSFEKGALCTPIFRPCDVVVNYGFLASQYDYEAVYENSSTALCSRAEPRLLLGPSYAPIRESLKPKKGERFTRDPLRVLVTSGATNPCKTLEKMVKACIAACESSSPDIDVVVGPLAEFDIEIVLATNRSSRESIRVHRHVKDLASLLSAVDIVISAGGSTLYEIGYVGVAAIAVPIAENQTRNVQGFVDLGMGLGVDGGLHWKVDDLAVVLEQLVRNAELRMSLSNKAQKIIDGKGAERIAQALLIQ